MSQEDFSSRAPKRCQILNFGEIYRKREFLRFVCSMHEFTVGKRRFTAYIPKIIKKKKNEADKFIDAELPDRKEGMLIKFSGGFVCQENLTLTEEGKAENAQILPNKLFCSRYELHYIKSGSDSLCFDLYIDDKIKLPQEVFKTCTFDQIKCKFNKMGKKSPDFTVHEKMTKNSKEPHHHRNIDDQSPLTNVHKDRLLDTKGSFDKLEVKQANYDKFSLYRYDLGEFEIFPSVSQRGYIPINFHGTVLTETKQPIHLKIRKGNSFEGPEFQASWQKDTNVICSWDTNLEKTWTNVQIFLEKKGFLNENDENFLKKNPLVLFGIAETETQKSLKRLERQAVLICEGEKPTMENWASYLLVNFEEEEHKWIIKAFATSELPTPWSSFKGPGSVVNFINYENNITTWVHPLYDYFAQLLKFCHLRPKIQGRADVEVLKIRIHKLLWSYEVNYSKNPNMQFNKPLLCPEILKEMAEIFNIDVVREGHLVRVLKNACKIFSNQYRDRTDIEKDEIVKFLERLELEREKEKTLLQHWKSHSSTDRFDLVEILNLEKLTRGDFECVECGERALAFCFSCEDFLCLVCFEKLHKKGHRKSHIAFKCKNCEICVKMPGKLSINEIFLCNECYAMKFIYTLKEETEKVKKPTKIDYQSQKDALIKKRNEERSGVLLMSSIVSRRSTLQEDGQDLDIQAFNVWHAFFDNKGIEYFYNFETGETMRRNPVEILGTEKEKA